MILSRRQVTLAAVATLALAAGSLWQVRENRRLRLEAARQEASASANLAALEKEVALQSQRLAGAEARLGMLLKAAEAARAAAPTASAAPPIDAAEAVKVALARAAQLIKESKFQEALDVYLACYREVQPIRPGSSECQRLISAIRHLGRTYPAAMSGLAGLRDSAMAQWQAEPNRRELIFEIAVLNERLGEGSRTVALYDSLPPTDSRRQSLAMIALTSFIEARRYADALLGKPFGQMLNTIQVGTEQHAKLAITPAQREAMRQGIVDATLTNIEVLTGAGQADDARRLTEELLAFDGTEATRAALRRHLARAQSAVR